MTKNRSMEFKNLNELPIYEPGLAKLLKNKGKNLFFSEDTDKAICESQIIFLAVNTPTKTKEKKGFYADLSNVENAKRIAKVSKL